MITPISYNRLPSSERANLAFCIARKMYLGQTNLRTWACLACLAGSGWVGWAVWAGLGSLGSLGCVWCPGLAWLALLGRALVPRPPRGEKNTFFGERPRRRPAKNAKAQDFPSDFTGPKKLVVGLASFRQNRSANL